MRRTALVTGAAGGIGEPGVGKADAPQRANQHIGEGGKPQAQLVGAHGASRGTVGIEVQLALLDPVLHLAAGAIKIFVQAAGVDLLR